ncbi:MATE family efflux transporter [Fervidobacterium nodosum]|uniref:Multidrug-efflux transporter n=1 Tax=Fervidobacterium nodosum (strain ATCC 35602 / DSM 5306 / Rt17-B1) TaxID=381764 RepID=A7HLH3_FERNB|nr:MATE family efflux transporter [Fervidobacterium nodosum]ABS60756.1 MATE efflux family protein [Fervidobacterium nodosum Rt17-B1]PHJ12793.1 multidrug transporter MATE [Fervidobacterium sp. SC_NGM5_G05]HOJ93616.1 MATE family efflux transporter [Fervidobacterium nodosum]
MAKVNVLNERIEYSLFHLAWPLIVSNALQTIYNIVDSYFLGKLGPVQFSASTITWPVIFTFISLAMGFSNAGIAIVSQSYGKMDIQKVKKSMGQLYLVTISVGLLATVLGIAFAKPILNSIAGSESRDVVPYALKYYIVDMLGLPLVFIINSTTSAIRAVGDSQFGMRITLYMNLVNMFFDPLLIFGIGPFPKLGVAGAAWATNIGRFIAAGISLYHVASKQAHVKISKSDFKPDWKIIGLIFKLGLPSALGMSITSAGFAVIMKYVAMFGPAVISAYGIGNRVTNLVSMISFGLAGAVSTMVGQFIGAKRYKDAEYTVLKAFYWNITIIGVLSLLTFIYGKQVTQFFINDPKVIQMGEIYFKYISFSMPIFTAYMIYNNALIGAGKTILTMVGDILRLWGIRIPIIATLSLTFGFKGIFVGMIISNLIVFVITYLFFRLSNWKKSVV